MMVMHCQIQKYLVIFLTIICCYVLINELTHLKNLYFSYVLFAVYQYNWQFDQQRDIILLQMKQQKYIPYTSPEEIQLLRGQASDEMSESVDVDNQESTHIKITKDDLICMLRNYALKFQQLEAKQKREQSVRLSKPSDSKLNKFFFMNPSFGLFDIMLKSLNGQDLNISQFEYICNFFKLNDKRVKQVSCTDPFILQTLRYAIHNRQEIPSLLVNVINRMARCHMKKDWEVGPMIMGKLFFEIYAEVFEPPLDLYLKFVDYKLINPEQSDLIEVFKRNQFLFDSKINNTQQEQYNESQKRKLVLSQFPYLVDIFTRICHEADFNFGRFKYYLNLVLNVLHYVKREQLFDRYLPEVTCRYLKIQGNLTKQDILYMFTCLKSAGQLTFEDLKLIYSTKKDLVIKGYQFENAKSWRKFMQIKQLCSSLLINPNLRLTKKRIQEIDGLLHYKKQGIAIDVIISNLCLTILKQVSYRKQIFSKSLFKNLSGILEEVPDDRIKKEVTYILLQQYYSLMEEGYHIDQIAQILPFSKIDEILNEGRLLALDLLLQNQIQKQIDTSNLKYFEEILKNSIKNNHHIRNKCLRLYEKLFKIKFSAQYMDYFQKRLQQKKYMIYYIEKSVQNGNIISLSTIDNIFKIILTYSDSQIKKSCNETLIKMIKNMKKSKQQIPVKFSEKISEVILHLSYQAKQKTETILSSQNQLKSIRTLVVNPKKLQFIHIIFKLMVECLINDILVNLTAYECLTYYALGSDKYVEPILLYLIFHIMGHKNEHLSNKILYNFTQLLNEMEQTSAPKILQIFSIHFFKKYKQIPEECKKVLMGSSLWEQCLTGACLHLCSFSQECLFYEVKKKNEVIPSKQKIKIEDSLSKKFEYLSKQRKNK